MSRGLGQRLYYTHTTSHYMLNIKRIDNVTNATINIMTNTTSIIMGYISSAAIPGPCAYRLPSEGPVNTYASTFHHMLVKDRGDSTHNI